MKKVILIILIIILLAMIYIWQSGIIERKINPLEYKELIYKYSEKYNLDPYLIMAFIRTESSFKHDAVSHAGAKGLMQITEATAHQSAEKIGIEDFSSEMLFDPEININIGTWYLKWLLEQFNYNEETTFAAYNAGIGRVRSWLNNEEYSKDGINLHYIPYEETRNFVKRIKKFRETYRRLY